MIEINLLRKKKGIELPVVLGIDLNQVNFKMLAVAWALTYTPKWFLKPELDKETKVVEVQLKDLQTKLRKLKKDVGNNSNVEEQLEAFNRQVQKLKKRSSQVEEIIQDKSNPRKLLERLARDIPQDMWFKDLVISNDRKIEINGASESYKSIGDFIISANDSQFFGKSLILTGSNTVTEKNADGEQRVEQFNIKGSISAYEPFGGNR
ncbi:MAG: PilN domain-containing protein [Bacteriovoracaceae bacterium]|nr:PilN domain-containing protein [Bacteriovoracaceae bacterium]